MLDPAYTPHGNDVPSLQEENKWFA